MSLHSIPSLSITDGHLSWAGLRACVSRLCTRPSVQHSSPRPQPRQEDFGQDANAHPTPNLIQPTPAFILNNIQHWSQLPAPTRPVRCDMEVRGSSDIRIHETTRLRTRAHIAQGSSHPPTNRCSNKARSPADRRPFGVRLASPRSSWPSAMHGTPNGCLRSGFSFAGMCMFSQPPFLGCPETHRYGAYGAYEWAPLSALSRDRRNTRPHTPQE